MDPVEPAKLYVLNPVELTKLYVGVPKNPGQRGAKTLGQWGAKSPGQWGAKNPGLDNLNIFRRLFPEIFSNNLRPVRKQ